MKNLPNPEEAERDTQGNGSAEGLAEQQWQRLIRGFELDDEEFNRLGMRRASRRCRSSDAESRTRERKLTLS